MRAPDNSQIWMQSAVVFDFRGYRLSAHSEGRGPALLLIHGFPTSSYDWAALWPELAEHFSLHAIDMLGFGLSDKPRDFAYSVSASADQWQAYVAAKGLAEVSILAHDYGDTVAQELLARQQAGLLPFRISSVTFLNGGLFPEATHPLLIQKLLQSPFGSIVARLISYGGFAGSLRRICTQAPSEAELRAHWQLLTRAEGRRVMPKLIQYIGERRRYRARWCEALQQAKIPLCAVIGIDDPISGMTIVRRWRELLPQSPCVELVGVGHYPQLEDPERVLSAFLGGFARKRPCA